MSAATHKYTFDVWPADAGDRTLPRVEVRQAATRAGALASVTAALASGETVTPRGHVRSQCDPPHPGRD